MRVSGGVGRVEHVELRCSSDAVAEAWRLGYGKVVVDHRVEAASLSRSFKPEVKAPAGALSRVTIVLDGPRLDLPKAVLTRFDVIAVEASSEKAFAHACGNDNVDVVALGGRFAISRSAVLAALKRGGCLELAYAPAIEDPTAIRHLVAAAARLADAARGRGVVLSSGATNPRFLRPPPDVANLARFLGLKRDLTPYAWQVLRRAEARRNARLARWLPPGNVVRVLSEALRRAEDEPPREAEAEAEASASGAPEKEENAATCEEGVIRNHSPVIESAVEMPDESGVSSGRRRALGGEMKTNVAKRRRLQAIFIRKRRVVVG
ncbi:hypothetical protein CTAYLR_006302 [Chrysophaeum taylorii]|uniref:Uncharacterized protein n=1 Tax=Chrysophaeum taylorii TaxID=2483200 RepID=A0AAD7UAU1_9STRA|nr:hypothetical protein CTAYLR_006302 [Chrysophaeum taylorii]